MKLDKILKFIVLTFIFCTAVKTINADAYTGQCIYEFESGKILPGDGAKDIIKITMTYDDKLKCSCGIEGWRVCYCSNNIEEGELFVYEDDMLYCPNKVYVSLSTPHSPSGYSLTTQWYNFETELDVCTITGTDGGKINSKLFSEPDNLTITPMGKATKYTPNVVGKKCETGGKDSKNYSSITNNLSNLKTEIEILESNMNDFENSIDNYNYTNNEGTNESLEDYYKGRLSNIEDIKDAYMQKWNDTSSGYDALSDKLTNYIETLSAEKLSYCNKEGAKTADDQVELLKKRLEELSKKQGDSNTKDTVLYKYDKKYNQIAKKGQENGVNLDDEISEHKNEMNELNNESRAREEDLQALQNLINSTMGAAGGFEIPFNETAYSCDDLIGGNLLKIIRTVLKIVQICAPILLILLGAVDFGGVVLSQDQDSMKKAISKFVKRAIAAIVVFFIPFLVNLLISFTNDAIKSDCTLMDANTEDTVE